MNRDDTSGRLKYAAALRGGVLGGAVAAIGVTVAIRTLQPDLLPWFWMPATGWLDRVLNWTSAIGVLVPIGIALGIVQALACALVFEYVTRRATWRIGAFVGLIAGLMGAAALGLVPWAGSRFGYVYRGPVAPLGPRDPSSIFVAVILAAIVAGAISGGCYRVREKTRVGVPSRFSGGRG